MADRWIGLCVTGEREALERAVRLVDPAAHLALVTTAWELREQAQEGRGSTGVIVGPCGGGDVSEVNVAAAIVRDGMAACVVLACRGVSEEVRDRAVRAGIEHVVDLASLPPDSAYDLEEPIMPEDDLPTMVLDVGTRPRIPWEAVPQVEQTSSSRAQHVRSATPHDGDEPSAALVPPAAYAPPAAYDPSTGQRIPVLRETSHGMEVVMPEAPAQAPVREQARAGSAPASASQGRAPIVTMVSGRGGVGKTSLVAAMAYAASSWGLRVAACDLDLTCGNLYSCLGARGPADLASLREADALTNELVRSCSTKVSESLHLWGPCELPELAETVAPKTGELLDVLAGNHDLVLVDTSASITDAVAQAVQACDRLVLVVDGKPGSMVAQTRLGALAVRLGVARTRIVRLANRCGPRGKGEPVINRADVGLETARPLRVFEGGPDVVDCLAEGNVGELFELGSRFAESAATALAKLLEEMGKLPDCPDARQALEESKERSRWSFGKRREAV